ncbi:MAG: hypothetical protein KDD42_07745, partial [Bdellovibrionales bacterium]|nr:hypothetical protein [Bdellovibrionales bacterium]
DAIVIPESAVMLRGDSAQVFVVKDGHAELRQVSMGKHLQNQVEIVHGVDPGEQVIIEGIQKLGPGSPVHIQQPTKQQQG